MRATLVPLLLAFLLHASWASTEEQEAQVRGDCLYSPWSEWTIRGFGDVRVRERVVLRPASDGGAACPPLTESEGITLPPGPMRPPPIEQVAEAFEDNFLIRKRSGAGSASEVIHRDLLFIVDMSGSIGFSEFQKAKHALAMIIPKLCGGVGPLWYQNRVAVITYDSVVVENFDFKFHSSVAAIQAKILNIPYSGEMTYTGDALTYAANRIFTTAAGMRSDSAKEVLIITDGQSNGGESLVTAIPKPHAKVNGAFAMAINIDGNYPSAKREIESLCSTPTYDHLFVLKDYDAFLQMADMTDSTQQCSVISHGAVSPPGL